MTDEHSHLFNWNDAASISCEFAFKCPKTWERLTPTATRRSGIAWNAIEMSILSLLRKTFDDTGRRGTVWLSQSKEKKVSVRMWVISCLPMMHRKCGISFRSRS